jgi:hypothetical protein
MVLTIHKWLSRSIIIIQGLLVQIRGNLKPSTILMAQDNYSWTRNQLSKLWANVNHQNLDLNQLLEEELIELGKKFDLSPPLGLKATLNQPIAHLTNHWTLQWIIIKVTYRQMCPSKKAQILNGLSRKIINKDLLRIWKENTQEWLITRRLCLKGSFKIRVGFIQCQISFRGMKILLIKCQNSSLVLWLEIKLAEINSAFLIQMSSSLLIWCQETFLKIDQKQANFENLIHHELNPQWRISLSKLINTCTN